MVSQNIVPQFWLKSPKNWPADFTAFVHYKAPEGSLQLTFILK